MKVASDLGGTRGFGPVEAEANEPVFHADWEGRVLALVLAMGATGTWNLDMSRFAREDRPPDEYLSLSYYRIWLAGLERLLVEHGLATSAELAAGIPLSSPSTIRRRPNVEDIVTLLSTGTPTLRSPESAARFSEGDVVRTTTAEPSGHTRMPSYARGKLGRVTAVHGCHVYPDANAHGLGEQPQWLYTVEFSGNALYGDASDPRTIVSIDAFEPYLSLA